MTAHRPVNMMSWWWCTCLSPYLSMSFNIWMLVYWVRGQCGCILIFEHLKRLKLFMRIDIVEEILRKIYFLMVMAQYFNWIQFPFAFSFTFSNANNFFTSHWTFANDIMITTMNINRLFTHLDNSIPFNGWKKMRLKELSAIKMNEFNKCSAKFCHNKTDFQIKMIAQFLPDFFSFLLFTFLFY